MGEEEGSVWYEKKNFHCIFFKFSFCFFLFAKKKMGKGEKGLYKKILRYYTNTNVEASETKKTTKQKWSLGGI